MAETSQPPLTQELSSWRFSVGDAEAGELIRLPHDAMLHEKRDPHAPGGADVAYYPGGKYVYRTTWEAPTNPYAYAALRFEGVQGDAVVSVNGSVVGDVRSGYVEFEFPIGNRLHWGSSNDIVVEVDNSNQPASRWYPGSGLYRTVRLMLRSDTRFASDGVRLRTTSLTPEEASVDVSYQLIASDSANAVVSIDIVDDSRIVASGSGRGGEGTVQLHMADPKPWTAETPHLYELISRVLVGGTVTDERRERVGLRTITVDARRGLQINGRVELLRGACIHHDNGPLGAATHRSAEFRRIRLLKDAGFNAIRSAHNPMSRHLLDACDEIGMYVLDELADYWVVSKTAHDYAWRFRGTWREDADRLVEKDRNRPSVIMYAAGNEIPETAKEEGIALTREITDYLHHLDPDRPVTLATNLFLNTLVSLDKSPYKERSESDTGTSMAGSTEANVMINQIGRMMDIVSRLPRADRASRDAFAQVDVAGYNYGLGRYEGDIRRYPDRVILGSETLPGDVARAWTKVTKYPAVIGDFVWAGWEYLGEAGVAVWVPGKRAGLSKPYPYLIAGPGMFDLIGQPDITLRLAQAAWGRLPAPAIGVRPLDRSGEPMVRSAWRKTDAVESWSWRGCENRKAEIEVYSSSDTVEVLLNGHRIGRKRAGRQKSFLARFTAPYEPGTLTAVAYSKGVEVSRTTLVSAQEDLRLRLSSSTESATDDDLVFAEISISDGAGIVEMLADEEVDVSVSGPGELIGFGSAAPATAEPFTTSRSSTFRGRALAIIRPTGEAGTITITATAPTWGQAELVVSCDPSPNRSAVAATHSATAITQ